MASRLMSPRWRNAVASSTKALEKISLTRDTSGIVQWRHERREKRSYLNSECRTQSSCHSPSQHDHARRCFSTILHVSQPPENETTPPRSRQMLPGLDDASANDPLHVDTSHLHPAKERKPLSEDVTRSIEESPISSLIGIERPLLQYISDTQELERLVSVVESCRVLSSDDVESWVHPLMLATSKLESIDGAHMTERLLAKCLDHAGNQDREALTDYLNLPFPSAEMYNMAIGAWTKAPSQACGKRATELLQLMSEEYRRECDYVRAYNDIHGDQVRRVRAPRPDIINYTTVMNALSKSGTKRGILQAQSMLEEMEQLSGVTQMLASHETEGRGEKPLAYLMPDQACYNGVIKGWARSSEYYATSHIERLMHRMDALHELTGDNRFQPDTQSFHMLIKAYAKAAQQNRRNKERSRQACVCAENVLRVMYDRYSKERTMHMYDSDDANNNCVTAKPDTMVYNAIISAWANSATVDGAKRAESILLAMLGESKAPDDFPIVDDIFPNTVTFNTAIHAWATSGAADAGKHAARLLEIMVACGSADLQPDTVTFNALMNAWSRSSSPDSGEHVESILNFMLNKENGARPNVISFSTAISAWARSAHKDGGHRAELLLDQMERLHTDYKGHSLRPTEACYDGAILAWLRRSGNKVLYDGFFAAERAEALLQRMKDAGGVSPGLKQYNRVLNAWLKHEDCNDDEGPNKVERVSLLLQEMSSTATGDAVSYKNKPLFCRPDVASYNYVIATCASCTEQPDSFATACDAYNRLFESETSAPDTSTYQLMLDICVKQLPRSTELIEQVFRECCEHGLLNNGILRMARTHFPPWLTQRILGRRAQMVAGKDIYVTDLPRKWSCNRTIKRPRR